MSAHPTSLPVQGGELCGLAWFDGSLWYSDARLEAIVAVDPGTGAELARLPCPDVRTGLAAADGGRYLIQVAGADRRLRVLDPYTGRQAGDYANPRPGAQPCGLHDTPGGLWISFRHPSLVELRRHGDLDAMLSIPLAEDVTDLTVAGGALVFADRRGRLNVLDPETGVVGNRLPVAGIPSGLTWDGERLWYADRRGGRLYRVVADFLRPGVSG